MDGSYIGLYWYNYKNKRRGNNAKYKIFLENLTLKTDYEKCITKVKSDEMSIADKFIELKKYIDTYGIVPPRCSEVKFKNGVNIAEFWQSCKYLKRCHRDEYKIFLTNDILKQDYENYLQTNRKKLKLHEKFEELNAYVNTNGIPKRRSKDTFSDTTLMSRFWQEYKFSLKGDKDEYKIFLNNSILKDDYTRYINSKV